MLFKSSPQNVADREAIRAYLEPLPDGEEVTWMRVEADTRIRMDHRGRNLVRDTLRALKRPYEPVRGEGVRLSTPQRAMTILGARFVRVDGAVKEAARTQKELQARHLEKMSPGDQQKMLMAASFFGAIRAFAQDARKKLAG